MSYCEGKTQDKTYFWKSATPQQQNKIIIACINKFLICSQILFLVLLLRFMLYIADFVAGLPHFLSATEWPVDKICTTSSETTAMFILSTADIKKGLRHSFSQM